ncbi:AraC family transcriptional regulator [Rubrivivax sp. JA1024]|nr:AraC family transcriptional regulator [Rubrivivax sp. JA1024]
MAPEDPRRLLQGFEIQHADDPATAYEIAREHYGCELGTSPREGFRTSTICAQLPNLSLLVSATSLPVRLLTKSSRMLHLHLCRSGHCTLTDGERRFEIGKDQALICSPGRPALLDFSADYEELVLRVPPAMLKRVLASLLGFVPRGHLVFEPNVATDTPHFSGLRELLMLLAGTLDPEFSVWPRAALTRLEQACVVSLLYCSQHNFTDLLTSPATKAVPKIILDAEHLADSAAESRVDVEQMAKTAGVSTSTLTRAFLKSRGYTPAAYAKRAKLNHAKMLLETGAATTLIGVALRCGFANSSRFAQDYRETFGESPIETLRRSRPGRSPDPEKH